MNNRIILLIVMLILVNDCKTTQRQKRMLVYKLRSLMGIFIAVAVPIDIPTPDVFFSYVFEGNYYLPSSIDELDGMGLFTPITELSREKRSFNRRIVYEILEEQLTRSGYKGRQCLLRAICEIAAIPVIGNGILGDIAHIIFTPSSSKDEDLPKSFYLAEKRGQGGECDQYVKRCSSNFLDLISIIKN